MTVGIVGLGLIGGSLAKAYKEVPGILVYGADRDPSVQQIARLSGAIDGVLDGDTLAACDCLLVALPPRAAVAWLRANAPAIPKKTLVMDCCGTKVRVCEAGFALAEQYGFEFAGGHPMAGTHRWGFAHSRADLFHGACFVVVPRTFDDIRLLDRIKGCLTPAGFGSVSVSTAERHDRLIAFTSQLAHLVSNAYIKSPTASGHRGFSAGSYQDLTRVAWLHPAMWAELFLENKEHLLCELDTLLAALGEYRRALEAGDEDALTALLEAGKTCKERVDGYANNHRPGTVKNL
ncbi:MAG: prephenate dehydrogenase [Eubacteriales bacterium]